jgi:hypothetical protein
MQLAIIEGKPATSGVIMKKYEKPTLVKREKLSSVVAVVISGPV